MNIRIAMIMRGGVPQLQNHVCTHRHMYMQPAPVDQFLKMQMQLQVNVWQVFAAHCAAR
jgi:hypothetical protein